MPEHLQRLIRAQRLARSTRELAQIIGVQELEIVRWLAGETSTEESDMLEVAISLLEMRITQARRHSGDITMPIAAMPA
jgi:hypothetical protein